MLAALLGCSACSVDDGAADGAGTDEGSETGGDGDCEGVGTFESEVQPIFSQSCALAGCHGGDAPQQGLSLEPGSAYASLVGVESTEAPGVLRVAPGDPEASFLLDKLGPSPSVGQRMPFGGELAQAQTDTIEAWIAAGAPETEPFSACQPDGSGVASLELDGPASVEVGMLASLSVIALDADGVEISDPAVVFTSASGELLFVDRNGTALGVSPGTVEVVASVGTIESEPLSVEVVAHDPPAAAFLADVLPVLSSTCAVAGCHVDGVEPGDLRFDREPDRVWEELAEPSAELGPMLRIEPNAPLESYLMLKLVLREPPVGGQMPLGSAPIEAESAQAILRWILAGAPFD